MTIAERFKFHKRTQREGESVAEYVVALKELTTHCEFGGFLNEALRDRLVCGLYRESTQKRLLTEVDLTFKKACEIAQAMEMADKNASELNSEATQGVHALEKPARESYKEAGATTKTRNYKAGGATAVEAYICQLIVDLRLRSAVNAERLATSKENATLNSFFKAR